MTSWLFGVVFLIATFGELFMPLTDRQTRWPALISLLIAALTLPPFRRLVHQKTGKSLSTPARVILVLVLLPFALFWGSDLQH